MAASPHTTVPATALRQALHDFVKMNAMDYRPIALLQSGYKVVAKVLYMLYMYTLYPKGIHTLP